MEANEKPKATAKKKAWWIRVLDKWKKPFHDKWFRPRRDSVGKAIGYAALYGFVWLILLLLIWTLSTIRWVWKKMTHSPATILASVLGILIGIGGTLAWGRIKGEEAVHNVTENLPIFKDLPENDAGRYIARWKDTAIQIRDSHGIPASITLAQALLESGNGLSRVTREGRNHFGFKCGKSWTGRFVLADDDKPKERFRAYDTDLESYADYARLLRTDHYNKHLKGLSPKDYKGWAKGLKAAGYATDPPYAKKLINLIELYDLHQYD